jgi:hypothetical protein
MRRIATAVSLAALTFAAPVALAQSSPADTAAVAAPRTKPGYTAPRLAIGQPDLQGAWSNASITGLTRPSEFKSLVLTPEEAQKSAAANPLVVRQQTDDAGSTLTQQDGKDLNSGRGYNAFWISPGTSFGNVKDTFRTSWIVDPPNGQIPLSAEGRKLMSDPAARRRGTGYDHPEERSLGERCIVSFAGNGGPVMMNSRYYNDNYRITQSPTHVVIEVEMVHDARVIPLHKSASEARGALKTAAAVPQWLGRSVGWWEGDTLVVETAGFHPDQFMAGRVAVSETGKVVERFTRYSDDQVLYEFEVHDPKLYSQVWKGEMAFNKLSGDGDVYEYACHEGNYGLHNILAGGRKNDREGKSNSVAGDRDDG